MSTFSLHAPLGHAERHKGFFATLIEMIQRSRQMQADHIIAHYRHLLPQELEQAGNRLSARNEDSLPFNRL